MNTMAKLAVAAAIAVNFTAPAHTETRAFPNYDITASCNDPYRGIKGEKCLSMETEARANLRLVWNRIPEHLLDLCVKPNATELVDRSYYVTVTCIQLQDAVAQQLQDWRAVLRGEPK